MDEPELFLGMPDQRVGRGPDARVICLPPPDDSPKKRPAKKGSRERSEGFICERKNINRGRHYGGGRNRASPSFRPRELPL